MERFTVNSSRRLILIVRFVDTLLWFLTIILLQLTTATDSSIAPLPAHHRHHHHPPQGLHSPVRWTKSPLNTRRRPVDVMTDVLNDLGARILDRYLDNNGNVGFSPSGLGFILAALYEGSAGSSNQEISDILGLPRDRRVTRIGLRDIHRRLRSYLNADAFLGGLTLNRDDINLRPDYEDVLRFYGFDISDSGTNDNVTNPVSRINDNATNSVSGINDNATNSVSGTNDNATNSDSGTNDNATNPDVSMNSGTIAPDSSTISDSTNSTVTVQVTTITDSMLNGGSNDSVDMTTPIDANTAFSVGPSDDVSSTSNISADLTIMSLTIAIDNATNSTNSSSTTPISTGSTITGTSLTTEALTALPIVEIVPNITDSSSTIAPIQRLVGIGTEAPVTQTQSSAETTDTNPTMTTTTNPTTPIATIPISPVTLPMSIGIEGSDSTTTEVENSTINVAGDTATNRVRKRRGILHRSNGYFSSSADDGIWLDEFGRFNNHDDYPSQDDDIVVDTRGTTEVAFLINGCDYSRVTAAIYTAFLPFAYFPSLRTSLLEFPLDDPRYKILVMLPSDENGTRRLARILATKPITLRHLRRSLQPTWVTAVIPSFMLRGFVTLTPYLQRLGISDVFDPRAADLTPMSPDLGVYARDIQQSIGVNIRNNAKRGVGSADGGNDKQNGNTQQRDDLIRNTRGLEGLPPFFVAGGSISPRSLGNLPYPSYPVAGNPLYERGPPVPFVVDHPFLYFIIDDETSVTLLAGRIDDPLNSRML